LLYLYIRLRFVLSGIGTVIPPIQGDTWVEPVPLKYPAHTALSLNLLPYPRQSHINDVDYFKQFTASIILHPSEAKINFMYTLTHDLVIAMEPASCYSFRINPPDRNRV